ncbi:glycosyltransferase family 2 protein [Erythrobacter litoralis]|uniref:glycosyltransferase family 2 protein n=1 Tax=Erythrobacter litoralis TaxID=39960 RepID=UPI002435E8B0|nr:glycosyltransferase family 2 protein [Erythrobacter litoralis]
MLNSASASVAIVVPTYNRPDKLARCLTFLERLDGGPYRTIVVDDGSPQDLAPVCAPYEWVQLVRQDNAGPGAARNTGAKKAEGADLLVFTDDDCRPRTDWVRNLVTAQNGKPLLLVGGKVENALPDNVFSSASQSLCSFLYEYYHSHGSEMTFFTTNNMICRREDFLALGGFDTDFAIASEDRDFSLRWKSHGGTLAYAEDAVIDHAHDLSLRSFWKQHSNYGRGARKLHTTMDGRADDRPKIENAGFYFGMLTYPLRARLRRPLSQAFLVGLSQVAMVAGYAKAIREEKRA